MMSFPLLDPAFELCFNRVYRYELLAPKYFVRDEKHAKILGLVPIQYEKKGEMGGGLGV